MNEINYAVVSVGCLECSDYGDCMPKIEHVTQDFEAASKVAKKYSDEGGHGGDAFVMRISSDPKIVSFKSEDGYWLESNENLLHNMKADHRLEEGK